VSQFANHFGFSRTLSDIAIVIQAEVFGVTGVPVATLGGSATLLTVAMLLASILPGALPD
jgi:hypothetical protein